MTGIDLFNNVGSGALANATSISEGPAGSMLILGLGATFILAIAGLVVGFIYLIRR